MSDLLAKIGFKKESNTVKPEPDPVLSLSDYEGEPILNVAYPDGSLTCVLVSKSVAHCMGAVDRALNPPSEANQEDLIHLTQRALVSIRSIEEDLGLEIHDQLAKHEDILWDKLTNLLKGTHPLFNNVTTEI